VRAVLQEAALELRVPALKKGALVN
jgi:hypothetical protein